MADKHKTFVSFIQHTILLYVLFVHAITLNAHEPEEFWWHPYAMDMENMYSLNADSVASVLDTMANPDSVFFAKLALSHHYYVRGEYEQSAVVLLGLQYNISIGLLQVSDPEHMLLGVRLLEAERNMMQHVAGAGVFMFLLNDYYNAELDHPVKVGALYLGIKIYMKTIGPEYSKILEGIKRAYYAARRLQYWEPLGELSGWMARYGFINEAEFTELYEQLPPRPKSYALIYAPELKYTSLADGDQFREMYRLGGPRNVFGWFRGSIELTNYFLQVGQLDSARHYLDEATKAAGFLNDIEVDFHLNAVGLTYYQLMADSATVQYLKGEKEQLDSLMAQDKVYNNVLLANNAALDLEESKLALQKRNQLLIGLLGGMGIIMLLLALQTIRVVTQRKQLRRANDDKAMLYGMIAHDLRSPLAALDSVIQQEGTREDMQHSVRNYARKLQFLLDDMLKWTFDQRQQLKPQPTTFDLVELVEENHQLLAQVLADKSITVQWHMEEEVVMYADREMMSTCVRNMLQNAVKHIAVGSQIIIRCREEEGKAVLEIDNEGSLSQRGGRSLGLQLIQSFSRLNNCRFSLEEHEGRVVAQLTGPNQ